MKLQRVLIVGLGLSLAGCGEKEQAAPEPVDEAPMAAAEAPAAVDESWRNAGFLKHMHLHAEKLDDINFALDDGNLEAAMTPAYWLSRHDTYEDVPQEWLPYLYRMRTEAQAVESAPDVATARAAAERINAECQACHATAGMATQ
jgi:cytochrome c5